jgi:integrase
LTKYSVDQASPRAVPYWDSELAGFGLRVGKNGTKTFFLRYRPKGTGRQGPKKYYTIGRYGPLTPAEARNKARQLLGEVAGGADPAAKLAAARGAISVAELARRYFRDEVQPKRRPGTAALYEIHLRKHVLPDLGDVKAEKVTRAMVARLHLKIGKTHEVTANRVKALLSGMFAFGIAHDLLPAEMINPAKNVEKFREISRERFLGDLELERLGAALREAETVGIPWQVDETGPNAKHLVHKERRLTVLSLFATAAIRLLLFTGCRLREILNLKWEGVDFDRGMLHLPESKTGKKSVVLNAPALAIIAALPRLDGAYVIGGDHPAHPRADLKRPWKLICRRAGLEGLRLHDLRHSFASVGAGAGLGLPVIGKLLGHASPATTARYAHLDNDPVRRATNAIGATISAAMDPKPSTESVFSLRDGGAMDDAERQRAMRLANVACLANDPVRELAERLGAQSLGGQTADDIADLAKKA